MEGSVFSMPSRDEKINIRHLLHGRGLVYSASFQECFLPNVSLEMIGSLLYIRKTYPLKDSSHLKVAPFTISNFKKTDPFTSAPSSFTAYVYLSVAI